MHSRFIKFSTASGNHYFYDSDSSEILKISKIVYAILDDFGVLDDERVVAKYSDTFGEKNVREAIYALSHSVESGLLRQCPIKKTPGVVGITLDGERVFSLEEFLKTYSSRSILIWMPWDFSTAISSWVA